MKLATPVQADDGGRAPDNKKSAAAAAGTQVPDPFAGALDRFLDGTAKLQEVREVLAKSLYDSLEPAEPMLAALEEAKQKRGLPPAAFAALARDLRQITTEETPTDVSLGSSRQARRPVTERAGKRPLQSSAPRAAPAIRPGMLLRGRFQLEDRLPGGNMGELYRAIDRLRVEAGEDDVTVAIKILKPGLSKSTEALDRFRKEALNAQRLAHPNIVRVFDLDQSNGQFFITMEWLRGESLAARLDDIGPRPMVWSQAKRILEGLGAGLEYTHREGLVHGDIKPGNVYLTSDHGVKLLDFGLATAAATGPDSIGGVKRPFAITREYASREVLSGQRPTIQDDVFSLACLAYRLLAGYRPFKNGSRDASQLSRPKGLGLKQWATLRRGLAPDRKDRPASVRELLDPLLAERWSLHRLIGQRAAVAAVLMAVGAAMLWVLSPQRPDPSAPRQQSGPPSSETTPVIAPPPPVVGQPAATGAAIDDLSNGGESDSPAMGSDDPSPAPQIEDASQTGEALGTQALPGLEAVSEPAPEASAGGLSVTALEQPPQEAAPQKLSTPLPEADAPVVIESGFAQARYEVGESDTFVRLSVLAPRGLAGPVTWQIRTVDGAALDGQDYIGNIADRITLATGADSAEILIPIVSDALPEVIEDFIVVLDDPDDSAALSRSEAVVLIIDDDS